MVLEEILLELDKISQWVTKIKDNLENANKKISNRKKFKELKEINYNPEDYLEIGGRCEICISRNCPQCPYLTKDEVGD